jgi:hypothetical protein
MSLYLVDYTLHACMYSSNQLAIGVNEEYTRNQVYHKLAPAACRPFSLTTIRSLGMRYAFTHRMCTHRALQDLKDKSLTATGLP